ncbi:MAG: adenosine deaminase [Pseudomonadota bacterium]
MTIPKVELHLHLEGAAPPDFVRGLAAEKNVDLSRIFDDRGHYQFADFWEFLRVYEAATAVLQSPDDFYRLTRAVLAESAAAGVVYTEAFLSPDFCGDRDLVAWKDYLAAIETAAAEAERTDGVTLCGVVTCIRHLGPDKAKETALCAAETAGAFVRGFGIAGDETAGNPADFGWSFDMAREAGLRLTAHAGEWGGPESVRDALTHLRVERIGHGVRAIEDPTLVEDLVERGTVLEVCPGSNMALGLYPDWSAHPITRLRDAGVKVTVSTDDPPFFHTTMTREYEELLRIGWDEASLDAINEAALNAAFCDGETRTRIAGRLKKNG